MRNIIDNNGESGNSWSTALNAERYQFIKFPIFVSFISIVIYLARFLVFLLQISLSNGRQII
jgi:hypothetical protein